MVHWSDYSLRGWLSFLCFTHIGTAFRCFFDKQFLRTKIFTTDAANDTAFHHVYGVWSILHAIILLQSAIYLYDIAVQKIAIGSLLLSVLYFIIEALSFKSIMIHISSLFPFAMSGITLTWLVIYHYVWQPFKRGDLEHETEFLLKGIPIQKSNRRKR